MTAAAMLVFTQIRNKSNVEELKDSMIKSFMSGLIEIEIANRMNLPKTEIGFLCAMFQNLGRNLTIYYFPEEYSDIISLLEEKGLTMHEASSRVQTAPESVDSHSLKADSLSNQEGTKNDVEKKGAVFHQKLMQLFTKIAGKK
jgi:HD-like signal output (HDOD) protein